MDESPLLKKQKLAEKGPEKVDWKKWKAERKEKTKKLKEATFLKTLEKQKRKQKEEEEEERKKQLQEEEIKRRGRPYTVSIALPGSVLDNAQSPELRTYLAGQIARACAVFCVDEVVVFDEQGDDTKYLRKSFFPKHQDLQFAGLLNPLDSPHHMRMDEESEFREGVVLDRPCKPGKGSFVNCGMRKEVQIDRQLQAGLRVTVRLDKSQNPESRVQKGRVVAPHVPRTESGHYWGYSVRLASCLSKVFTECSFKEGYDLTIGTSERGSRVDSVTLSPFKHALIVFGGLQGLEASLDTDQNLDVTDPSMLFDHYLNTCPNQGSRTIRTEEAILITLSALRQKIETAV
ncbi:putative methyltransferase C9orf114 homolog isoform X2 [Polyodon spathula]|uniref:putative methyltransferase C9orf114 homolog isoform X2 n=1 Tax=Polyodon spathula TaxID=7913 RepID=UPI001B7EF487|nr:putative methyltransferase C9orf114 homolog isoform X2 [Polyodon spathula]